jgi:predicted AAA+ superfamily ATPase
VGKSTALMHIAEKERKYVSLDDLQLRQLAKTDPELFIQHNPPPIIIDEIQYAPELFPYIKIYADKHPDEKGAFWLTGSQQFGLMQGVQESLTGRVAILNLLGFSYKEKINKAETSKPFLPDMEPSKEEKPLKISNVYDLILEGSFPELTVNKKMDRETFYSSYVQSYIERDVKDFYQIAKPIQFYNFLVATAARTGNLVNYASLASDIGIDLKTAQKWMGILERSGIVYILKPYSPNITNRIIKTPKIYFLDTGLCSYLTKWTTSENLMSGAMDGQILETYVFGEILKSYFHNGKTPNICFYRDTDQKEIDFIIEENMTLYPIEVKKTAMPDNNVIRHFSILERLEKKVGTGAVICLQSKKIPINRSVMAMPVWEI